MTDNAVRITGAFPMRRQRLTILEEISIPVPSPANVLAEALTIIAKDVTLNNVTVNVCPDLVTLSYEHTTTDNGPLWSPNGASPTPTPPTAPQAVSAPPAPRPAAPVRKADPAPAPKAVEPPTPAPPTHPPKQKHEGEGAATSKDVVPPFPTKPTGDLPELTVEASREVVKHPGTFYFRLPMDADQGHLQMLRMRPKNSARVHSKTTGSETLVEVRVVRPAKAIAVTVVTEEAKPASRAS